MKKVKLQVPMDQDVRDGLELLARELGFDSAQAYIRVWAKNQLRKSAAVPVVDDWGEPTDEAAARINRWAEEAKEDIKAGKLKSFSSVDDFLAELKK